ncbi:MAG: radical SAM protein [Candidatus Pseudomonas phytovorans]|uniref:Radical SAM protein n=1 Tax=Candidatus Pseudomonas phytovorans TaxID=3121377 RepID=A0AAJ6BA01_9PSED|nr:radical SAM protein [Pseudomonas sp.]WEK29193.1 MAG: radical SAM protein [Pseudomonas sp.]
MQLLDRGLLKFDYQFPLYNFFYPSQAHEVYQPATHRFAEIMTAANRVARSRALYFHIPFCDAICTFCPFTRGLYKSASDIDRYTQALIGEISHKAQMMDLKAVPVRAIFFGGGTPSLLSPENIHEIGEALHRHFDMRDVQEFSFEFSITSVTEERARALAAIGVTHARFGLQTIDREWRQLFNLDPDIGKIERAVEQLRGHFGHVLCDILYGMNGSHEQQTLADIDKAVAMGVSNVDIYPINNAATSVKLHKQIKARFADVMPAMRKLNMKFMLDEHLRQYGYVPYNGHGYVLRPGADSSLFANDYSFIYHEHVYGYADHDLLGFGVGAISSVAGHVITNTPSREKYTQRMTAGEHLCQVSGHDPLLDAVKPLVVRLAYHGLVDKRLVAMDRMPEALLSRLDALIQAGLVVEDTYHYRLTRLGWLWYSNIMFYLMPASEQDILRKLVFERLDVPGRDITEHELIYAAG